ncbi:MAG TPA: 2-oxoglutarate dehydrogenase complex dihydrolipoyllysine-residue succinyltransferase [Desulfobacterales bacterium]|nr:2-oxoglutarate dehydrogenase complex dihydrolipoyllysine-residue succinyltransferase [Desulfobacterales bacterium]
MKVEIKIPSVGESVQEAVLVQWYKQNGDRVYKDDPLFVIETDKITLEVSAEVEGFLEISVSEGETVAIGAVVGTIDATTVSDKIKKSVEQKAVEPAQAPPRPPEPGRILPPSVRRLIAEQNLDVSKIIPTGPGSRITKGDVLLHLEKLGSGVLNQRPSVIPDREPSVSSSAPPLPAVAPEKEQTVRKPMSPIRLRIAAHLLDARQNTAMLTTFNEIDMTRVQEIRARYKADFKKKNGVSLGIMSFFIKACVNALKKFPEINAFIEDRDIVYHNYCHVGVAIGSERGLVVPVIRHADQLSYATLEQSIVAFVNKIKENQLALADLEGGTFTISNGGIYGSLLSTPILNMPQSGILGLHKIENRPMAIDKKVIIKPMMYVALSYDHRIVDGREAVTFLGNIKEWIEDPEWTSAEIS